MRRLKFLRVFALAIVFMLWVVSSALAIGSTPAPRAPSPAPAPAPRAPSPSPAPASRPASSPSSSSPKSYSSSGPKVGSGGQRPSSFARPSSGRVQQSAPANRLLPRSLPPGVRVPRGRNFVRDSARLRSSPRYYDPYDPLYFGNPASPYFYMYLASLQDNNRANPVPYQGQQCKPKHKGHSTGALVAWAVIMLIVGLLIGVIAGRATADNTRGGW